MSLILRERPAEVAERWWQTRNLIQENQITERVALVGIRGFYSPNVYGAYDDAAFLIYPMGWRGFNFNTDPVRHHPGHGFLEDKKGMATLKPGVYHYKLGLHKNQYQALVQAEPVTVYRDADAYEGDEDVVTVDGFKFYEDTGDFGIHIHRGGINTTGSLGCQTVPPEQWDEFIELVQKQMALSQQKAIPYLLIDNINL